MAEEKRTLGDVLEESRILAIRSIDEYYKALKEIFKEKLKEVIE